MIDGAGTLKVSQTRIEFSFNYYGTGRSILRTIQHRFGGTLEMRARAKGTRRYRMDYKIHFL